VGTVRSALYSRCHRHPAGLNGLIFPFYVNDLKLLAHLNEWQPADFTNFSEFGAILLATLFIMLVRPIRILPIRVVLLLGMLHLTLQHTRQEIVLVVVGMLVLAEPIGKAWAPANRVVPRPAPSGQRTRREAAHVAMLVLLLTIGLAAFRIAVPIVRPDRAGVPVIAFATCRQTSAPGASSTNTASADR
jgi:hypothetical protein